jgi:hypothetical protein
LSFIAQAMGLKDFSVLLKMLTQSQKNFDINFLIPYLLNLQISKNTTKAELAVVGAACTINDVLGL